MLRISLFLLTALLSVIYTTDLKAQREQVKNLPNFDKKNWHFGFALSFNQADFYLDRKRDPDFKDSLLVLESINKPGFNLAILAHCHFNESFGVRFVPGLSFQDRMLNYTFLKSNGKISVVEKPVDATFLDLPITFQYRSHRLNNFAAYLLAGGKYSIDMASRENDSNVDEIMVKMKKHDYSVEVGAGFDFYLPYFKFGIELKLGIGIPNLAVPEDNIFSTPIDRFRSKLFVVSFTFEG